jgi:O-antigen ligase
LAGGITAFLLLIILLTGPIVLGGARLWIQLPLLGVVTLLLVIQASRLATVPAIGALRQIDAIDLSVLLFVLYAIVRWLTSPAEYFSRLEVLNVIGYAVILLTCRYGLPHRRHGLAIVIALMLLGAGETAFGWFLSHHSNPAQPQTLWFLYGPAESLQLHYFPRWVGTYGNPNHYATLLVMATGAALALGGFSRFNWPLRILCFYVAAMMLVGIVYSASRGAWIGLTASFLALTLFGLRHTRLPRWVPLAGMLVIAAVMGGLLASSQLVSRRMNEAESTLRQHQLDSYIRIQLAHDAIRIARDHPLFGTGPATFTFVDPRYQGATFPVLAELTHDDYLNCLDDYGLVGFAIALVFVFLVTLALFRPIPPEARSADRVLAATGLAAWCALLVHSALDFNLHIPANAMMLFALTGLGLRRPPGVDPEHHWSSLSLARFGRGLGWTLLAFGLLDGLQVLRTGISDLVYEQAFSQALTAPTGRTLQAMQDALTFDRGNAHAMLLQGDLYRVRASRQKEMAGRIDQGEQALTAYQQALKMNPLDDTVKARMGLTFDLMRRYPEAFFSYQAAVAAQPYNGQFWSALGHHFWERGLLEKAEEAYNLAARCPHGFEGAADNARQIQSLLDQQGIPAPAPGLNPLEPQPEPATTP